MTDPAVAAPRLTPDQLEELQTLLVGADSVELKLTVPDDDQRSAVRALGMWTRSRPETARSSSSTPQPHAQQAGAHRASPADHKG